MKANTVTIQAVKGDDTFDAAETYGFIFNELQNAGIRAYVEHRIKTDSVAISGVGDEPFDADEVFDFVMNELDYADIHAYVATGYEP